MIVSPINSDSFRAGITATTPGQEPPSLAFRISSRWSVAQNRPLKSVSQPQASNAETDRPAPTHTPTSMLIGLV